MTRDLLYFLTVLCINNILICDAINCTIEDVNYGTIIGNQYSDGDIVEESTTYSVSCNSGYQLSDLTTADIPCITGQIPQSCRELRILYTSLEYGTDYEVTLTCRVTADDTVTAIVWSKDGETFRETGTFAANQTSPYQSILTFTATSFDSGEYGCEATFDGEFDTETFTDVVDITILSVIMGPVDEEPVYLLIGEDFPLVCNFTNMPSYTLQTTWKMGEGTVTNKYDETIGAVISSRMTLSATATPSRSNNYTCSGAYDSISDNIEIFVSTSKLVEIRGFSTQPDDQYIGVGDDAVFTCIAVGETEGEIEWLISGTAQDASLYTMEYTESSRATKSILSLDAAEKQSSVVKCRATYGNDTLQSDEAAFNVFSIGFITMPADSGFAELADYELTCVVQSEEAITTAITWYKGSTAMASETYSTSWNDNNTVGTSLLYFNDVETADEGDYKCRVDYYISSETTTMDSDIATVYVREVRFRPTDEWLVSTSDSDQQTFTCYYIGDADPGTGVEAVSWWANNVNVEGVDNFEITEGSFSGTNWKSIMKMTTISPELAGKIECRYDCGVGGSISGEGQLYVHRQIAMPATTLTSSATTTITCSARTNEAATVTWFRDVDPIGLNDANFAAQEATVEDYTQHNTLEVTGWSQTKDVTTITCKYRYDTTDAEYTTTTEFMFKGFTSGPDIYTYYLPSEKTLNCYFGYSYTTDGPAEATWYKDGVSLVGNDRYEMTSDLQSGMYGIGLRIKADTGDVIQQDSGGYTCSYVYSEDEVYNRTANVHFYTISTSPDDTEFYDSSALTLTCELENAGIDITSVEWTVGELELTPPAFNASLSGNTTTLVINQVIEENSGSYTCNYVVPNNRRIKEVHNIEIQNINMLRDEYITVALGDNIQLSCSVTNFTAVSLKWYKGGALVNGAEELVFASLVLTNTLTITNIESTDLGEYVCGIGDSRSRDSTSLSASDITAASTTIVQGMAATVSCLLTGSTVEPSEVYWTDDTGDEYDSSESEYTVTTGDYDTGTGEQSTSLEISDLEITTQYTCNFIIDGVTSNRRATVNVLHIITSPALVYTGSPASLKCRLEGSPSTPTATWTGIPDSGYTVNTLPYVASEGKLETEVQIDEATTDETFTCVFTIDSVEFSKTVQVEVYEVTALEFYVTLRTTPLEIQLQMEPNIDDISLLVVNMMVTPNTTVNGEAVISDLSVTFSTVFAFMSVEFQFVDNGGITRTLSSIVYVVEFHSPIVSLSDGFVSAEMTCTMTGVDGDLWDQLSAYWMVGETKRYDNEFTTSGDTLNTHYTVDMTGSSTDQNYTCGVELGQDTYTNTAILDKIEIVCPDEVTITDGVAQTMSCEVSGSQYIEPIKSIWYHGNEQLLIQILTDSGWPESSVATTLNDVTSAGSYRCVIDFGITEFSRTITAVLDDGTDNGGEDGEPTPTPEPPISASRTSLIVGITVPLVLVLALFGVVTFCYFKKFRRRRNSFNPNIKTLSLNSNSFGRPESLIYHNGQQPGGLTRAEMYEHRSEAYNSVHYQNFRDENRALAQTPNPHVYTSASEGGAVTPRSIGQPVMGRNTPVDRDGSHRKAPTPEGRPLPDPRRAPIPEGRPLPRRPTPDGRPLSSRRAPSTPGDRNDPGNKYNRDFNARAHSRNLNRDDFQSSRA